MRYVFKGILLLLGIYLLYHIIQKVGVDQLMHGVRTLGWKMVIPIIITAPGYLLYAWSWHLSLKRFEHRDVPFWDLLKIKVAGEGGNTLTPLNFAGGDSLRIWMLSKSCPVDVSGASVVVDRTMQIIAIVALILLGNVAALVIMPLPPAVRTIIAAMLALLVSLIVFFVFCQTKGLFQKLTQIAAKLHIKKFSDGTLQKIANLDNYVSGFYRQDKKIFVTCVFLYFLARLTGVVEIYFVGRCLGVPMGPWEALFFAAVIPLTNVVASVIPGSLGVLEGVVTALFTSLHWNPANAIVLQIARRVRATFWIILGMLVLLLYRHKKAAQPVA